MSQNANYSTFTLENSTILQCTLTAVKIKKSAANYLSKFTILYIIWQLPLLRTLLKTVKLSNLFYILTEQAASVRK